MFSMRGCPPLSISPSLQSQETVGVISSACNFSSQQVSAKCGRQQPGIQLHYYNLKEEILMSMIRRVAGRKYF